MSRKTPSAELTSIKTFNVAVVGLSGTEREKGVTGVGKSCLINRFVRPNADDYFTDHISILSQSDFAGRVVNNDHFLYWGDTMRMSDDGSDVKFHIVEQTEFADDSSFQSFRIGKTEPYVKRCAALRLQSAEKLAYICKNQLGLEHEFEQKLLPDGRISIDGFICVFDVSEVGHRPLVRQVEHVQGILLQIAKTKKPVVLATTKSDEAQRTHEVEVERLVGRKELRGAGPIPIVETSAHENVNVELAFMTLAHLIERGGTSAGKNRPRIITFPEASKARREVIEVATEAYQGLIRAQVTDYNLQWEMVKRRLHSDSDFIHFTELCGSSQAERVFRRHLTRLRDEFVRHRQSQHLRRLEIILRDILPDLSTIADRSWYSTLLWLKRQPFFDCFFLVVPEESSWKDPFYLESRDDRIPFDMLEIPEAESVFRNHVNLLRLEQKKAELKRQFKQLLEDNRHVGPGKSLAEVAIFFLGRECFTNLTEKEKQEIYDEYQNKLRADARREFLELLLENAESLSGFEHVLVTNEDIRDINDHLQNEPRFRALARMEEDRRAILLNHLGFIQRSYRDSCPFREKCSEVLIEQIQAMQARRPRLWNRNSQLLLDTQDNKVQFVILGSGGLADQLADEIRMQCVEDEYMLDGDLFTLEYRPVDSDIMLLSNLSLDEQFRPQGCFCVYHSESTLECVRLSLEKTLLSDLQRDDRQPFQGLPIVLVLGHNPDVSEKGLSTLREEGQALADRLQCPFVDIPSSMMVNGNRRFHEDQIGLAMHQLIIAIKRRSSASIRPWHITAECIEPDIRVLMCVMCGDGFDVELPLAPLLNHQFSIVSSSPDGVVSVALETYFDESKHKVEVVVTSYHGASQLKDCLFHGFLLVYWAKRKASLSALRAFARKLSNAPTLVLAVTETGANVFFSSEQMKTLLTEGNAFADSRHASFMTTCANFQQQTASYSVFFKECWELKSDTELSYNSAVGGTISGTGRSGAQLVLPNPAVHERMKNRPPAALPKCLAPSTMAKSSTSNSADDSDTANGDLNAESSDQRPSSASSLPATRLLAPLPMGNAAESNGVAEYDDVYSEIMSQDTEFLIKPSTGSVKQPQAARSRRNIYANRYRKSFPGSSNSFTSSGYFCDVSTTEDTDGSGGGFSSPKLHRTRNTGYISTAVRCSSFSPLAALALGEPRYQFRKSNSMKLALKEDEEGSVEKSLGMDNKSPPPTKPKSRQSERNKAFDTSRVLEGYQMSPSPTFGSLGKPAAPLATPDPIDVFGDYAQVKDALDLPAVVPIENNYASVADILPAGRLHRIRSTVNRKQGGSESDSEYSSAELDRQKDPWVNRRQAALFKKKQHHKPRGSNAGEDHQALLHSDQLEKVCDYSPSDGTDGTADEVENSIAMTAAPVGKGNKKKKSIRGSRKKTQDSEQQGTYTNSDVVAPRKASVDEDGKELITWRQRLRLRSEKDNDGERQSRKEDRKSRNAQEDERRSKSKSKLDKSRSPGRKFKKDSKLSLYGRGKDGATLEELARSSSSLVPEFVKACVEYVEAEGLATEGLYRVPGSRAHVDLLMECFRDDPNFDMTQASVSINAVGTALKQFFSELREPVIPQSFYSSLQDAVNMADRTMRLLAIRGILQKLDPANFAVLKFIITHLNRVSKSSSLNNMDCKNLSICWWPTLMWPEILSMDTMYLTTRPLEELVFLLIEQCGFFFYGESEVT